MISFRRFSAAAVSIFGVFLCSTAVFASDITVVVNGKEIYFEDQGAEIVDGRTLVPLRGVFDSMGFLVEWDEVSRSAKISNSLKDITMTENIKRVTTNSKTIDIDVAPQIINNRLMIPLRAVAESIDAKVDWDGTEKTVSIYYGKAKEIDKSVDNMQLHEQQYLKTLISMNEYLRDAASGVPDAVLTYVANMGNYYDVSVPVVTDEQYDEIESHLKKFSEIEAPDVMSDVDRCVKKYADLIENMIKFSRVSNPRNIYDRNDENFMSRIDSFKTELEELNSKFGNYLITYFNENKVFWEGIYGESVIDLLMY